MVFFCFSFLLFFYPLKLPVLGSGPSRRELPLHTHPPLRVLEPLLPSRRDSTLSSLSVPLRSSKQSFSPTSPSPRNLAVPASSHAAPLSLPVSLPTPFSSLHSSQIPFFSLFQTPVPLSPQLPNMFVLAPRLYLHHLQVHPKASLHTPLGP